MFDKIPLAACSGDSGSIFYNVWRSTFRAWNGLSRFQRNVVYIALAVAAFFGLCHFFLVRTGPPHRPLTYVGSGMESRLSKLVRSKVFERHGEQINMPMPDDGKGDDDDDDHEKRDVRNRVERVREALDEKAPAVVKDLGVAVDENEDRAAEEEQDRNEVRAADGDESDLAEETFEEALPPADGSLKFRGPTNERQRAVVGAFKHAWTNYRQFAWGDDHLKPMSKTGHNWFGFGLTLIDSLDTLLVMNLSEEFAEAAGWVRDKLSFDKDAYVNLFETTIRVLGGLLSAYHLTGDKMFLAKSEDLGDRLMGAFETPSDIPYSDINTWTGKGRSPLWSALSSTSEVSTIQLEFRDLSRSTGSDKFESAAEAVSKKIHQLDKRDGLVPIYIHPMSGQFQKSSVVTLGARGDSYYEYLLKQWIQKGKTEDYLKLDFLTAVQGVVDKLTRRTVPNRLLFVGELLSGGMFKPKMDELVCFLPGALALASHHGLKASGRLPPVERGKGGEVQPDVLLQFAEELAYTCYLTFARQPTFLGPEITHFNYEGSSTDDFYVKDNDSHYLLRPETIESLYYLYYVTGNKTYQDWGWNIFQGIEKHARVSNGYATVGNVRNALDLRRRDRMESFFLGETLKYLYLLFSDKHEIDLDRWVFNTEAHLLPIYPN